MTIDVERDGQGVLAAPLFDRHLGELVVIVKMAFSKTERG
jgi:hypothetical protein